MKQFEGQTLSWDVQDGVIELALHREPLNEISSVTLEEFEKFVATLNDLSREAHALILYSSLKSGFCAGANLSPPQKISPAKPPPALSPARKKAASRQAPICVNFTDGFRSTDIPRSPIMRGLIWSGFTR